MPELTWTQQEDYQRQQITFPSKNSQHSYCVLPERWRILLQRRRMDMESFEPKSTVPQPQRKPVKNSATNKSHSLKKLHFISHIQDWRRRASQSGMARPYNSALFWDCQKSRARSSSELKCKLTTNLLSLSFSLPLSLLPSLPLHINKLPVHTLK